MSLTRLFTRALACVALQKQDDDPVSPTMADDRVFDSRLDPLLFRDYTTPMPGIIVYTDDDEGDLINRGSGTGPFRRYVDLRVEIVIGSFNTEVVDNVEQLVFDLPMTDNQLEAQLDLFEAQVKWALFALPDRLYSHAFRKFVVRIESIRSHATREESGNNRFASRRIHFKLEIPDDCPPHWLGLEPGAAPPAKIPFCDDLSKFTAPWIAPMLQAMCNQPSMQGVLDVLAGTGNPMKYLPLLKRIGIDVKAGGLLLEFT
ncbi:MAG: hypothetical protein ACXWNL_16230 [Vulcanimicrobiaceae bacterium]